MTYEKIKVNKINDKYVIKKKILSASLWAIIMKQLKDKKLLQKISIIIKQLREENNLSQEAVYNDTNIHVGRIETANANLSVSTLAALCKYFGIKLSEFHKRIEDIK